ncbi:MAG: ankyrin repeat domain-containing protein [Verrucomicrobia bacterium]|nr:ankyrin repeat domain-containing protein [Verrucomicrobiota bacterium]
MLSHLPLMPAAAFQGEGFLKLPSGRIEFSISFNTDGSGAINNFVTRIPGYEALELGPNDIGVLFIKNQSTGQRFDCRFHNSAVSGDLSLAKAALNDGANINLRIKQNATALHWAAARGNTAVARWLVEHGADPDPVDDLGWTPLFLAADEGNGGLVNFLKAKGARTTGVVNGRQISLDPQTTVWKKAVLLRELMKRVTEGKIISATKEEHFQNIVQEMNLVGAARRSSTSEQFSGKLHIFDIYDMPDGTTILAGYPR